MGIFSLFGKKNGQTPDRTADQDATRRKRDEAQTNAGNTTQQAQRRAARSTTQKIDALESAMSLDLGTPSSLNGGKSARTRSFEKLSGGDAAPHTDFQSTLPMMEVSTDMLLNNSVALKQPEIIDSNSAAVIEETAILFAEGQNAIVEQMLREAIGQDQLGNANRTIWWMLFDLYQATGQHTAFDALSIDYAAKFEISSPAWVAATPLASVAPTPSGTTPIVAFSGQLDGNISQQLDRVQKFAGQHQVLRLEFTRVTGIDPIACTLLLQTFKQLQQSSHDLILVGALDLSEKIRAMLPVGQRDESESSWLLLLELLQLLNLEREFEEASIDYCITFEVSPPAFCAPKTRITTTATVPMPAQANGRFLMPPLVAGKVDSLFQELKAYAAEHDLLRIDCTGLSRIDFSAAGQLLSLLSPLHQAGKTIELLDVNYLIAALFNVMGINNIARILPHKN